MDESHKVIIITAPSGSGKTTIVNYLLQQFPTLHFSVSACTRKPRANEINGVHYHFLSLNDFQQKIKADAFAEYEMVYEGKYYGTLKSELQHAWAQQKIPLIDIDVQGALRLKKYYNQHALSIFIQAPSIQELRNRLKNRGTETQETLNERVEKANVELTFSHQFDCIVVNDILETACKNIEQRIIEFINK